MGFYIPFLINKVYLPHPSLVVSKVTGLHTPRHILYISTMVNSVVQHTYFRSPAPVNSVSVNTWFVEDIVSLPLLVITGQENIFYLQDLDSILFKDIDTLHKLCTTTPHLEYFPGDPHNKNTNNFSRLTPTNKVVALSLAPINCAFSSNINNYICIPPSRIWSNNHTITYNRSFLASLRILNKSLWMRAFFRPHPR